MHRSSSRDADDREEAKAPAASVTRCGDEGATAKERKFKISSTRKSEFTLKKAEERQGKKVSNRPLSKNHFAFFLRA